MIDWLFLGGCQPPDHLLIKAGESVEEKKQGSLMQCWNKEKQDAANKASCKHHHKHSPVPLSHALFFDYAILLLPMVLRLI